jgi:hypothetical protein
MVPASFPHSYFLIPTNKELSFHQQRTMNSLHSSAGAAALQRHRIREKMASILLEHDPSAAAAAASRTLPVPKFGGERKYTSHYQASAQSGGQSTAEVASPKLLPFPDPASNYIGLIGMTQTIIDDDTFFSPGVRKRTSPPSQLAAGVNEDKSKQSTTPRRRSFSTTKSSRRRSMKRHCREGTNSSTQHVTMQRLGDIYDLQLDRRAMKSNKRQKQQHHAVPPTTRDGRAENGTSNEAVTTPLSPVKRRLYQRNEEEDEHEEDEQLLTPVKMPEDDEMTNDSHSATKNHNPRVGLSDSSPDEDPFATIGHFLRLIE